MKKEMKLAMGSKQGDMKDFSDRSHEVKETRTNFAPPQDLRYTRGTPQDIVNRAKRYLDSLDSNDDTNSRINDFLISKREFTENEITSVKVIIDLAIQYKEDIDASQGIEAILKMNYSKPAFKTTIDWLAEAAPGG